MFRIIRIVLVEGIGYGFINHPCRVAVFFYKLGPQQGHLVHQFRKGRFQPLAVHIPLYHHTGVHLIGPGIFSEAPEQVHLTHGHGQGISFPGRDFRYPGYGCGQSILVHQFQDRRRPRPAEQLSVCQVGREFAAQHELEPYQFDGISAKDKKIVAWGNPGHQKDV